MVSAEDGKPDAEKSDFGGGSPFTDYREEEIGKNRLCFTATSS